MDRVLRIFIIPQDGIENFTWKSQFPDNEYILKTCGIFTVYHPNQFDKRVLMLDNAADTQINRKIQNCSQHAKDVELYIYRPNVNSLDSVQLDQAFRRTILHTLTLDDSDERYTCFQFAFDLDGWGLPFENYDVWIGKYWTKVSWDDKTAKIVLLFSESGELRHAMYEIWPELFIQKLGANYGVTVTTLQESKNLYKAHHAFRYQHIGLQHK